MLNAHVDEVLLQLKEINVKKLSKYNNFSLFVIHRNYFAELKIIQVWWKPTLVSVFLYATQNVHDDDGKDSAAV